MLRLILGGEVITAEIVFLVMQITAIVQSCRPALIIAYCLGAQWSEIENNFI